MKLQFLTSILLTISVFSVQANTQAEIEHLLDYVRSTDCQYERNGTMHTGAEAVKHIQRKYKHFADDIVTAEDFVRLSATKSMMSGKYYQVHCEGQPTVKSQDWFLIELKNYRLEQTDSPKLN
ncbi:DUF5329 family protein [Paraferrimonas sedimenticola]|uniref:DUF5329 domain-containing protein n=1 Tax=Paraferrimonas sedimenticola TaxID=375674 RepID=A0AA37VVS9_9GAMM|nr:DUF5329 family protein [Paraferrimonas sedimenticola]GLP96234.1 hypothetical protein GCM10007895_15400 [Paraferrimonas sedimenticola]